MPTLGVTVAVIYSNQILLTKREDFEVWSLPGGVVEDAESLAQAAVREIREETGLEVELTRLIGIYSRPRWRNGGSHNVLFAAKPIGGILQPQADEVIEAQYFDRHKLPEPLFYSHRQRILDAFNGIGGSVAYLQDTVWPFEREMTRQELYQLRDQSGLSRQAFYQQHFGDILKSADVILEVGEDVER